MSALSMRIFRDSTKRLGVTLNSVSVQSILETTTSRCVNQAPNIRVSIAGLHSESFSVSTKRNVHVATPRNVVNAAAKFAEPLYEDMDNYLEEKNDDVNWLCKASDDFKLYHVANSHKTRCGIGFVTLNSAKPLDFDLVKKAFEILQQGLPNLRMSTCKRGDELWIKEHLKPGFEFEVLPVDTDYKEALYQCSSEGFDSTDLPHWRVKLIPRSLDAPCGIPEVKEQFPYQYDYLLHPSHAFLDGINIALAIHLSHVILETLLRGKPFSFKKPVGEFVGMTDLEAVENVVRDSLWKDADRMAQVVDELPPSDKKLWVTETFGKPQVSQPTTKHTSRIIETDVMNRFQEKTKQAGVTFNSSFVAMVNTAFVELLKEEGVIRDSYRIDANHLVNLRRYLKNHKSVALGAYQQPLSYPSVVSSNVKDNFWEYTQSCHRDLQTKLNSAMVLEQKVMMKSMTPKRSYEEMFANPLPVLHDFTVSNVGDMTAFIPGTGKHVQITDLGAFNCIHKFIHNHMHQIVSYRGQCRYTVSYDTSYLNDETAERVADKVVSVLNELSQ